MIRFERAALTPMPWKNGGGVTREIIRRPIGASLDAITWRVSIADVDADGPFSVFPGIDRVIVLLGGHGVRLQSEDGRVSHSLIEALVPFAFAGEAQITGTLVSGRSSDFNVMTQRSMTRADVQVVREVCELPATTDGVLFAARGEWAIARVEGRRADETEMLPTGTGVWWADDAVAWRVEPHAPDAGLVIVRIFPRD